MAPELHGWTSKPAEPGGIARTDEQSLPYLLLRFLIIKTHFIILNR
jgi:hypothetical protein